MGDHGAQWAQYLVILFVYCFDWLRMFVDCLRIFVDCFDIF